ncbi:MAG: hypothetical protein ACLUUO_18620 [Sellimonas intestinalis]
MYIHQATKKAVKENKMMYRKCNADTRKNYNWDTSDRLICDVPYCKNKRWQGRGDIMSHWNPTRDDLVAKDWELMDRPLQKEWPEDKLNRFEIFNT